MPLQQQRAAAITAKPFLSGETIMKKLITVVAAAALVTGSLSTAAEETVPNPGVFAEIRYELGFVPKFFYRIPERSLRIEWESFKDMFLRADGPIDFKNKELIAIAVAGIKNCPYCTDLHTELAQYHGATQEEIEEAARVAVAVGHWSTFLHSIDYPVRLFKEEVERIIGNLP
jgi:AhpD family alkylhydroperoxidase